MERSKDCDWGGLRADFPALAQEVNGHRLAYLDSAATSQKPRAVLDALARFYEHDNSNVHRGIHTLGTRATLAFEGARSRVAAFLNAESDSEIVFTRGTTEGINLVANSWGRENIRAGDTILLTELEHHSNLVPWQMLAAATGARLEFVPVLDGDAGALDTNCLEPLLSARPKLFAFTHVSNTMGTENDARLFCSMARQYGVTTLVDAAQSAGHLPVDVREIGCDFLVFSGHKICGPTGIGILHGRRDLLDAMPPWQGGGEMISRVDYHHSQWNRAPHKFEAGTPNIADAVALTAALDYLDGIGRERIARRDTELGTLCAERLAQINGLRLFGPAAGRPRRGIVSFVLPGAHAHDVATLADQEGIALRAGHHCNQPLMAKLGVASTARASFYFYNTEDEIERLAATLEKIAKFFG